MVQTVTPDTDGVNGAPQVTWPLSAAAVIGALYSLDWALLLDPVSGVTVGL